MILLVLDTCTERLIVAVRDTTHPAEDRWINVDSEGNHARDLVLAAQELLGSRRPDVVGVALGPGSFTGVRIGLASAKGLAEGWKIPLVGLDNLEAMADGWSRLVPHSPAAVLPVIDARKKKFYGLLRSPHGLLVPAADLTPEGWLDNVSQLWTGPVVLSGYQGPLLAEVLGERLPPHWSVLGLHDWTPSLLDQGERGWNAKTFLGPDAGPRYLRLSEAEENRMSSTVGPGTKEGATSIR